MPAVSWPHEASYSSIASWHCIRLREAHPEKAGFRKMVAVLTSTNFEAGAHRFALEADVLPAGVYLARLVMDGRMSMSRITRIR